MSNQKVLEYRTSKVTKSFFGLITKDFKYCNFSLPQEVIDDLVGELDIEFKHSKAKYEGLLIYVGGALYGYTTDSGPNTGPSRLKTLNDTAVDKKLVHILLGMEKYYLGWCKNLNKAILDNRDKVNKENLRKAKESLNNG